MNILTRYLSSFVATSLIALNYSPSQFGLYQLVLSYVAVLEAIGLISPTHFKNYLIHNPDDESVVVTAWKVQSLGLAVAKILCISFIVLTNSKDIIWLLLLLASLKTIFSFYDYVAYLSEVRLQSQILQQGQMMSTFLYNLSRIFFAILQAPLSGLIFLNVFQGGVSAAYYRYIGDRDGYRTIPFLWDSQKFLKLIRDGIWPTLLTMFGVLQARIISILATDRMSLEDFGNLQLVLRLVEPASALCLVIFSANYTILAGTKARSPREFRTRFFKISTVCLLLSFLTFVGISVFPLEILLRVFGNTYSSGLSKLWLGALLVPSAAVLAISVHLDYLEVKYFSVMIKYISIFSVSALMIYNSPYLEIADAILIQILAPIAVVAVCDLRRIFF